MALLLSTDDWGKLPIQQHFVKDHGLSLWRTRGRYRKFLKNIPFPLHLYFFHASTIRYRTRCTRIERIARTQTGYTRTRYENAYIRTEKLTDLEAAQCYRLEDIPPEFRNDPVAYTLFFEIDEIVETSETHISSFPKWMNPNEFLDRGQLGLFKVVDICLK